MATTDVDICNLALGIIGDSRIQSRSERSKEASECDRFYDQALDEALEAFDWPFARSYSRGVTPSGIDAVTGYAHAFAVPSDTIAIRGIARSMRGQVSPEFTLSSVASPTGAYVRLIHTDRDGGVIVYTRRETFVPAFTPLFVAAVAAKLASYIAMPLTKSKEKRDDADKKYREVIEQAAVSVGNQGVPGLGGDAVPDWIEARG